MDEPDFGGRNDRLVYIVFLMSMHGSVISALSVFCTIILFSAEAEERISITMEETKSVENPQVRSHF